MDIVLLHSGGVDSTVLMHHLLADGHTVSGLSFDYGQRHARELQSAAALCQRSSVPHEVVDICSLSPLFSGSALTDTSVDVPSGHYTDLSMKATVVPNRNMILLSLALARAVSSKADAVAYAAHAGDHAIYPDCRPEFVAVMGEAARLCDWDEKRLLAPFVEFTKADIVRRGADLGVPFEQTWSCYRGGEAHCGTCGTCVERREAFKLAGIPDPTTYLEPILDKST